MTPYVVLADGALGDVVVDDVVTLDDDTRHHLVRVRRHRDGQSVTAADGSGREVDATLDGHGLVVEAVRDLPPPEPTIEVLQALGKQRKHDAVVRMLTEAGVDTVTALTTTRTQVDLTGKVDKVRARWTAVADAACAQARRPHRPRVTGPVDLAEVVADGFPDALALVADPTASTSPLAALAAAEPLPSRIVLVVGPEGGLVEAELVDLDAAGALPVSLGSTVLRTEHAALALSAVVAAGLGRMG